MYKRKYGRMTSSAWLNVELEQSSLFLTVFGGILTAGAFLAVRWHTGAPYRMMLELGIGDLVPPVWLFTLLQLLGFLTVGCAVGLVLGWREKGCAADKYKGCLLCLLTVIAELCWYPCLFGKGMVFLSLLLAITALVLAVSTAVSFFRVSGLSGILLSLHSVWLLYIFVFTCSVFFRN